MSDLDALVRESGGRALVVLDDPVPVKWPGLTPRERQVAEMICAGKERREIAALLGCKPNTVDSHRGRALTKLGVVNTVQMALFAAKKGWVQL